MNDTDWFSISIKASYKQVCQASATLFVRPSRFSDLTPLAHGDGTIPFFFFFFFFFKFGFFHTSMHRKGP